MTEVRRIDPESGFIRAFTEVSERVRSLETRPAGNIVIRETLSATDPQTGVKTVLGELPDGTVGFQPFIYDITPPPVATAPSVSVSPGIFSITWDGLFVANGELPRDFECVNIIGHKMDGAETVSSVPVGMIRRPLDITHITQDVCLVGETWQFSLESEDYNGNRAAWGARSASVVMESVVSDAGVTEALEALQEAADAADAAAYAAQQAADAAQADADAVASNLSSTNEAVAAAQLKADQAFNNAATAATAAGTAQTTADGKNRVWYQDNAPAGVSHRDGDIWFDTNDGNKIHLWKTANTAWVAAQDAAIIAAQGVADTALSSANGKTKTYYQTTEPSGGTYSTGDLWFDTDNNYKLHTYNGTIWQGTQDAAAAQAAAILAASNDATSKMDTAQRIAIAAQGYSLNPSFEDWSGALPANYTVFTNGPTKETSIVLTGKNAARFVCTDTTTQRGLQFSGALAHAPYFEYLTVELDVQLVSGTSFGGSGVLVDWTGMTGANRATVSLASEIPTPTIGKWYRVVKVIRKPATATGTFTNYSAWLMGQYSSSLGTMAVKDVIFDWINVRPATTEEITSFGLPATITTLTGTVNSKTKTYFQTAQPGTTGNTTGDLWFDTDDGNKPYVWNGSAWTVAQDAAIAAAQGTANTALTSANGKNKVYYQTTQPSGGTYIAGDTWFDTDDGYKIYVHNGSTWIASALGSSAIADLAITNAKIADATIASAKIAALDAGKITSGTIDANRIGANTISTAKLLVSDTTNLVEDAELSGNGWYRRSGAVASSNLVTTVGLPGRTWKLDGAGTEVSVATLAYFSVDPGAQYFLSVKAQNALTGTNASAYVRVYWFTETGAASATPFSGYTIGVSGWGTTSGTLTAPSDARRGVFTAIHGATATGGSWWFGLPTIRRKNEGSLIVDGAITAGSAIIATGAIGTAQIGDAQVTTAKIANLAVTDAQIAAATITSAKIASLDAGKITTGFLDAARIDAKTIGTEKLLIGSTDNLISEPDFTGNGRAWGTTPTGTYTIDPVGGRQTGSPALKIVNAATQQGKYNLPFEVPINEGSSYHFSAWIKADVPIPINGVTLYFRTKNAAGAFTIAAAVNSPAIAANTWEKISGIYKTPAGAITATFGVFSQSFLSTGNLWVDFVSVTRAADGSLIVDGAITAGSAIIANGAIGNAQIADLSADKITAGFIAAARLDAEVIRTKLIDATDINAVDILAAGSITATNGVIGSIDAGKITVGLIDTARIDAGTIGAEKLLVSNSTNVLPDPSFLITNITNARLTASSGGIAGWTVNAGTATGLRYLRRTTASTNDTLHFSPFTNGSGKQAQAIQVEAGQKWLLSVDVETNISAGVRFNVYQYLADGTTSYVLASGYSTSAVRRNLSYVWTVPNGVIAFYPAVACNTSGVVWTVYGNGFVGQQAKATLIENGAITTSHMTAGTIDASVITAGTITAPKIAAKSITVDKLVITSTNNLVVEADFSNNGSSWGLGNGAAYNATGGRASLPSLRFTNSTALNYSFNLVNKFTVDVDNRFRGAIMVKSTAALAAGKVQLRLRCYTTATAFTDILAASNPLLVANTWTNVTGISPALPSGTLAVEVYVQVQNPAIGTITDIDYVSLTRAADGNLVIDGAMDAKTITGALFQTTNTVNSGIKLDGLGFRAYSPIGEETFAIDAITGSISSVGTYYTEAVETLEYEGGTPYTLTSYAKFGVFNDDNTDLVPGIEFFRTYEGDTWSNPGRISYAGGLDISVRPANWTLEPGERMSNIGLQSGFIYSTATSRPASGANFNPSANMELSSRADEGHNYAGMDAMTYPTANYHGAIKPFIALSAETITANSSVQLGLYEYTQVEGQPYEGVRSSLLYMLPGGRWGLTGDTTLVDEGINNTAIYGNIGNDGRLVLQGNGGIAFQGDMTSYDDLTLTGGTVDAAKYKVSGVEMPLTNLSYYESTGSKANFDALNQGTGTPVYQSGQSTTNLATPGAGQLTVTTAGIYSVIVTFRMYNDSAMTSGRAATGRSFIDVSNASNDTYSRTALPVQEDQVTGGHPSLKLAANSVLKFNILQTSGGLAYYKIQIWLTRIG